MKQAQIRLPDDAAMRAYIDESEHAFEERLRTVCRTAAAGGRRILTLAGPSCSGKTTTASRLAQELHALGFPARAISMDHYFLPAINPDVPRDANREIGRAHV